MKILSGLTNEKIQNMETSELKSAIRYVGMDYYEKRSVSRKEYAIRMQQYEKLYDELDKRLGIER